MSKNNDNNANRKTTESFADSFSSLENKPENDFELVLARLKTVFGVETDTDLAKKLDLKQGSISAAKLKKSVPPAWITAVTLKHGISADWLLTGEGEMRRGLKFKPAALPNPEMDPACGTGGFVDLVAERALGRGLRTQDNIPETQQPEILTCFECELVMIPLVEAKLSAGNGSFETSGDSERRYAFRSDFLRRKGNPKTMVLMRVAGDSMEPKIEHDDVVLVDTSQREPHLGRMYAVAVEDLVYLKQVNAEPGKLVLTSANPAYAPLEIDARGDRADGIRIIGRAIWVGRELD